MNGIKYAGKTITGIAQERGSAAKTKSGAWKYLLANLPKPAGRRSSHPYDWERYRTARMERRADGRALVLGYSLDDPNTPGRIREEAWWMNREWDEACRKSIERNDYGDTYINRNATPAARPRPEVDGWLAALQLIKAAEISGAIPGSYDTIGFDRKGRADGSALHHDLYDFAPRAAIVCIRRTEGTQYGVKTLSKTYMLIESRRRKITAREITIPVAKYAKMQMLHYGDIVAIAQGKKRITLVTPGQLRRQEMLKTVHRGYKAVAIDQDGRYISVWDGSPWEIGVARIEVAHQDHIGGLYYYQDFQAMLEAAKNNGIFGRSKNHHRLAVLEVEATGIHIRYGHKLAASKITPVRQIASII